MLKLFTASDRHFRRWEPYVGIGLATGAFSFVGKHLEVFGELGWAEAIFLGLLAALALAGALGLYRYFRPLSQTVATSANETGLAEIRGRRFWNEKVQLDGHRYLNCDFKNVTFLYGGASFALEHNKMAGVTIEPTDQGLLNYTQLLFQFGYLKHPVHTSDGEMMNFNKFVAEDDSKAGSSV